MDHDWRPATPGVRDKPPAGAQKVGRKPAGIWESIGTYLLVENPKRRTSDMLGVRSSGGSGIGDHRDRENRHQDHKPKDEYKV